MKEKQIKYKSKKLRNRLPETQLSPGFPTKRPRPRCVQKQLLFLGFLSIFGRMNAGGIYTGI